MIIGPAHPLRGGLATFDERLARQFTAEGLDCSIYSFSLQYPGFLFPGTTQYSDQPAPEGIDIHTRINSINPFNWIGVGRELKRLAPDVIVVRFWIPLMGPCLGTILRIAKKNKHTRVVCIADNIIPHEKRFGDKPFTRYFLKPVDACITMSEKVLQDLRKFDETKPARQVLHPLYDNFGSKISKAEARKKLGIAEDDRLLLFFGFIRRYKGLDILFDALAIANAGKEHPYKLLVAGEFYEDRQPFTEQVDKLGIAPQLYLHTDFIPDSEVKYYLCAADVVVQPYRNATQSGVTPLAYHFEVPMIVTRVGGLPALVPDGRVGIVAEPDPASLAKAIDTFFEKGGQHFLPHLAEEKKRFSWEKMTESILQMAQSL